MTKKDWDKSYIQGDAPWDTGFPSSELKKVIQGGIVKPCCALDIGCGTGTNAIYLAQNGFEVFAVDASQVALEKAKAKSDTNGVNLNFTKSTLPNINLSDKTFDFIFDRGCFHAIENNMRTKFVAMLKKMTRKGSMYLMLCGNAKEPREDGPPTLTEGEIQDVFSPLFEFIWLKDFRFDTIGNNTGPLGYSCLMRISQI